MKGIDRKNRLRELIQRSLDALNGLIILYNSIPWSGCQVRQDDDNDSDDDPFEGIKIN